MYTSNIINTIMNNLCNYRSRRKFWPEFVDDSQDNITKPFKVEIGFWKSM
eukprot:m.8078 g.8078  ORF g.8078 m.8078 type:complete len:50 (-) comp5371_c0_seq2:1568-1717(-)